MEKDVWTTEEYKRFIATGKGPDRNKLSGAGAKLEPNPGNETSLPAKAQKDDSRYSVVIHHYRHRLIDPENLATKHFTDGIVNAGILPDDTAEKIEIHNKQHKIPKNLAERTVYIIETL